MWPFYVVLFVVGAVIGALIVFIAFSRDETIAHIDDKHVLVPKLYLKNLQSIAEKVMKQARQDSDTEEHSG